MAKYIRVGMLALSLFVLPLTLSAQSGSTPDNSTAGQAGTGRTGSSDDHSNWGYLGLLGLLGLAGLVPRRDRQTYVDPLHNKPANTH